jgi:hypothetical protein
MFQVQNGQIVHCAPLLVYNELVKQVLKNVYGKSIQTRKLLQIVHITKYFHNMTNKSYSH